MLNVEHIKKRYGNFCLDCSFKLKEGRITGIIGQNGSGKTTAFKAVLGLFKPDNGEIKLFNKRIENLTLKDKEKIAVVFSESGFNQEFTPKDLIPILKNLYKDFNEEYYRLELKSQKLPMDKKIKEFSTGMKTKLKIICALSYNPTLLILDEPTLGLDVIARNSFFDKLKNFMDEDPQRSILISSHNSYDLENLCDDFYLLHNGKILLYEETDKVLSDYALIKVTPEQFEEIPKNYLLSYQSKLYGYDCLTDQKQFYLENYPDIAIESATIDEVINLMTTGVTL